MLFSLPLIDLAPAHFMLLGKELQELFENLHIKLCCVTSPDHGSDFFIGAGKGEGRGSRNMAFPLPLEPCPA